MQVFQNVPPFSMPNGDVIPVGTVKWDHFQKLHAADSERLLSRAPKLTKRAIEPNSFQKCVSLVL